MDKTVVSTKESSICAIMLFHAQCTIVAGARGGKDRPQKRI